MACIYVRKWNPCLVHCLIGCCYFLCCSPVYRRSNLMTYALLTYRLLMNYVVPPLRISLFAFLNVIVLFFLLFASCHKIYQKIFFCQKLKFTVVSTLVIKKMYKIIRFCLLKRLVRGKLMKLVPESGNKCYTVADAGWSLAAHTQLPYTCVAAVQRGKITFNRQLL